MRDKIVKNIKEHQEVIKEVLQDDSILECIEHIVEIIVNSIQGGGKVLLAGNGGSAADAQHIAGEFIGRFLYDRRPLPAIALSTDTSVLTCVGNDYSFDDVFVRQVEALVCKEDVFIGLSTSGNSENIVKSAEAAKGKGAAVIGFTGKSGGKLKEIADICLCIPHTMTNRIQEGHMLVYHIICQLVEEKLCPNG